MYAPRILLIIIYLCQQDAHFMSFICFNYTILYMFRTNKFIIRRLLLYTQHLAFSMHVYVSVQ